MRQSLMRHSKRINILGNKDHTLAALSQGDSLLQGHRDMHVANM